MADPWDAWLGRQLTQADTLDEALATRWMATFDLPDRPDDAMPQGIHFALCTPEAGTAGLGVDGHPARDDSADSFFPPVPLPRRMWAASKIQFLAPIIRGASIERTSRIASIAQKEGRTGTLAFVDVEHLTRANGRDAVREVQTLVYRDAAPADTPLSPPEPGDGHFAAADWDAVRTLTPSEVLLFRYSALTFNTHRIHYDAPYARDAERYRGLVVHGPLIASLLLQLAAREHGANALASFSFRAISPAIVNEPLNLAIRVTDGVLELGAFAADGRQTMAANAALA